MTPYTPLQEALVTCACVWQRMARGSPKCVMTIPRLCQYVVPPILWGVSSGLLIPSIKVDFRRGVTEGGPPKESSGG